MHYVLLDIPKALEDADQALNDITWYVAVLQEETEGHVPTPTDAALLLANIAALRDLLAHVMPRGLQAAITAERESQAAEADDWELR